MARRAVVSTESQLAESQDATQLQRRARRRLIGAIALVVLVVIVLPIVLDKEPSPTGQDLVIQIPVQEAGKFKTRVLPPSQSESQPANAGETERSEPAKADSPKAAPVEVSPQAVQPPAQVEAKAAPSPVPASVTESAVPPPDAKPAETAASDGARAKSLLEGNEAWVVPLGAFSSRDNAKQLQAKLTTAGMKSYSELVKGAKGEQTRVRAGPFETKAAAEQAREKLAGMGLKPAAVVAR